MKLFISNLFKLLLLPYLILVFYLIILLNKTSNELNNSRLLKIYQDERLDSLKQIKGKIIFIGGSNLLFGLDISKISKNINRPVVSFAYLRTDGIENMLALAKRIYNKGDKVLISLEYGSASKGPSGYYLDYYLKRNNFQIINLMFLKLRNMNDLTDIVTDIKNQFIKNSKKTSIKDKKRFDVYSSFDQNFFLTKLQPSKLDFKYVQDYNNQGVDLNYSKVDVDIILSKRYKNIEMYGIHPAIARQSLSTNNTISIAKDQIQKLPIEYITNQKDYIFDTAYIFDFQYHLNSKGRTLRTKKLSSDILIFLNRKKSKEKYGKSKY